MKRRVWGIAREAADLTLDLPGEGGPMFFRRIPSGRFLMGSRGDYPDQEPTHRVGLGHDFHLSSFVVTQEQWKAVAERSEALRERTDPSHFKGLRRPVENVSWDDVTAWCEVLMKHSGFPRALIARLPTEAEWEYVCRAGTETDYYNGDGKAALAEVGWYGGNSGGQTHLVDEPVGGRVEVHPWGMYGMHGNVSEWCPDVYRRDGYRGRVDGEIAIEETIREGEAHQSHQRVFRGGSWVNGRRWCRSAARDRRHPDDRFMDQGFRACLAPGPARPQPQPTETEKAEAKPGPGDGGRGTSPESDGPGAAETGASGSLWDGVFPPRAKPAKK